MARPPRLSRREKEAAQARANVRRYVDIGKIKPRKRTKKQKADYSYFKKTIPREIVRDVKAPLEWAAFREREVKAEARAAGLPVPTEKIGIIRDKILKEYSASDVDERRKERREQYRVHIEELGRAPETFRYHPVYAGIAA